MARADHFPPAPATRSPATRAGIELGRRLFFDPRLSANDRISCATCHEPARAFSDGVARSARGISGATLARNAPGLANLAWVERLFWDGGAKNLESMVLGPIQHPDEMGETVARMIEQLAADPVMREAFARAFPGEGVTPSGVMRALAQYLRSLVSADSRYDRHVRGEAGGELADAELRGLAVVRAKCARCHATELFTDRAFHDIGLDPPSALPDEDPRRGRARVTFRAADERAFRTPSLRNLSYTAPYMHDGRFATLAEVLAHYRRGGVAGVALTDDEVDDVIAFLRALDDPDFVARHAR
ncbi:MAG: methylamine utilization protein [Deltaproteobacteria bacterium]|nr:methylamine utilization protein [Deltaproteobacteria bacterium]